MNRIKELQCTIAPSKVFTDYYTVDIYIKTNDGEKEAHELLPTNDFESRFTQMLRLFESEVVSAMTGREL